MRAFVVPSFRHAHPIVRALALVLGLALVGVLLVFGMVMIGVLLLGGTLLLAVRAWQQRGRVGRARKDGGRVRQPDVLEGDFTVVRERRPTAH